MDIFACIGIACIISFLIYIGLWTWFLILCTKWDNVEMSITDGVFKLKCSNS